MLSGTRTRVGLGDYGDAVLNGDVASRAGHNAPGLYLAVARFDWNSAVDAGYEVAGVLEVNGQDVAFLLEGLRLVVVEPKFERFHSGELLSGWMIEKFSGLFRRCHSTCR